MKILFCLRKSFEPAAKSFLKASDEFAQISQNFVFSTENGFDGGVDSFISCSGFNLSRGGALEVRAALLRPVKVRKR